MIRAVVLDSSPLSLLANPRASAEVIACNAWAATLRAAGIDIILPEIIDYELRRELLRANRTVSITLLDDLGTRLTYQPLTTLTLRRAAELWAEARRGGYPTAPNEALDVDVILAAQALTSGVPESELVVATSNPAHLSRYVNADLWTNVAP